MRVLVTGSQGYIGSILTTRLIEAGCDVEGLDVGWFNDCMFQQPPNGYVLRRQDMRDVAVDELIGFDAIVHLAALSNDPLGNLDPDLTMRLNHEGTLRLAKLAKQAEVRRFIVSSSCSIYGKAGDALIDENAQLNPVTAYGKSKALIDRDVSHLADAWFTPVFLRHATAYGVSPRLRLDLVLNDLVASAFLSGKILMLSDGTPWRPLVHVEDISRAFIAALKAPQEAVHNEAFNIGSTSENYQISELADFIRQAIPDATIEYAPNAGPDLRCYRVDFSKAERCLPGFNPQWTVARGVEQLLSAYRTRPLTANDASGPSFRRLARLQQLGAQGLIDEELRWTEPATEEAFQYSPSGEMTK
ncbi:NAD-dependent epimerase/dehydratase family protein [Bythopirellula polymerisocia]|uniref:UDP-glucose 4-epimerase n=1 Tax=Bythopirellula polymerisocia TaxID=2528003 RepID=A0A5C6C880_9BACT|nr:SDR family oxidoreductase [Bythopirellula polymerisocia]TWU20873.1 UDP-glucose 4-epimerase [Bythopirellula polymerisocia]